MGILDAPVTPASIGAAPLATATSEALSAARTAALRPARAALANRDYAPCNFVFNGTSMTEGGPFVSTGRQRRWLDRLAVSLRARHPLATPVTGSTGYIPAYFFTFNSGGTATTATNAGTVYLPPGCTIAGGPLTNYSSGMGGRSLGLTAAGQSYTVTIVGDSATLFFNTHTTVPATAGISIDGGAVINAAAPGTTLTGWRYEITGLSAGTHTVAITWVSGGPIVYQGIMPYNGDSAKGINVYDHGKGSSQASQFVGTGVWNHVAKTLPGLICFEFGYNEYFGNTDPTTFATNLSSDVSSALGQLTYVPTMLFIVWPEPYVASARSFPYQSYVNAVYAQAASTTNGVLVDFGKRLPAIATDNSLNLFASDKVHPTDKGAAYIADVLTKILSPE